MKVLLINGSPRKQGNTFLALSEVASALEKQGITTEIVSIGTKAVQGCIACNKCGELGRCVFRDELYDTLHGKLAGADGLVVGSPTYYAGPNGSLCAILDRLFYSAGELLRFKPAAAVAVCRRCERDVRQVEQVFHDQQHACRIVAILEQRTRPAARRSDAGCRRYADHAHAGRQHGVAAEKYPNGQDPSSGTGGARPDEFHPVNGQQKPRPHVGAFLVVSASVYGLKIK